MKGFSGKFVEKLWDLGKVKSVSDLYKLKEDDFLAVEGIGEKTVKNFFETLKATSEMFLEKFVKALGIESCSTTTAGILVEQFGTWDRIVSIKPDDLQRLPGFAETSSTTICDGIAEVKDMAEDLLKVIKIKKKKVGPLTGISVCVTGSLQSMGRKEFHDMVVDKGGIAKNSVVEGLTYLLTNDTSSGSAKNTKAKKLGVKVISEKDFFKLLGDSVPEKKEELKVATSKIKIESEKLF
jgi:DNA ligase (NAD+)